MCGLAGYLTPVARAAEPARLAGMLAPIRRRGPDDEGLFLAARRARTTHHLHTHRTVASRRERLRHVTEAGGIEHDLAILHTRYAVIDRGDEAHQPFELDGGEVVVAFQGEIFNYLELRAELESGGARFRTASDTEVLARAYVAWGDEAWSRLNGLWSAALYDARASRLVLCRDRLGIAPLHLAESDRGLFFGSSALGVARACFGSARPARGLAREFVETGLRNTDDRTLIAGVRCLPAGSFLSLPVDAHRVADGTVVRYWEIPDARLGAADLSIEDASAQLRELLASAVEYRLRADRDIAFQLSGGLDSTSVVALAAALRDEPLRTYTVSVPEQDEEPLARRMEERFRLERRTISSGEAGFLDAAPAFARLMEEPLQAPGAYGHHHMCRVMRDEGFGVTLTGSGGDEVLAGYEWDFWPVARRALVRDGRGLQAAAYHAVLRLGSPSRAAGTVEDWAGHAGRLVRRAGPVRDGPARATPRSPGGTRGSAECQPEGPTPDASGHTLSADDGPGPLELLRGYSGLDFDARCRYHLRIADLPYYLASNDRATLGIPLEHRQPFLDHRIVELGLRMPVAHLFRRGWTKYVLRRAMEPFLPPAILWNRTKTGFPFPVGRLLERGRSALEPALGRAEAATLALGTGPGSAADYGRLLREDPLALWRCCSIGLWLDALEETEAADPRPPM